MVKVRTLHVYIDANIFLSFYDFTSDNLDHLSEIATHLANGSLKIYLPEITRDEYYRNREDKIATSLKNFDNERVPSGGLPRIVEGYDEAKAYRQARDGLASAKDMLQKRIRADAGAFTLKADHIIQNLFEHCYVLPTSPEQFADAVVRRDLRQPPGKSDSLGDQLAWECLKGAVPAGVDLHIVTKDSDWSSSLNPSKIRNPIQSEWRALKESDSILHRSLKDFLDIANLGVNIEIDQDRYELVSSLYDSPSYAATHRVVERLATFDDFTVEELELLASAALTNTQVSDILEDDDVQRFFRGVLEKHGNALHRNVRAALEAVLPKDDADATAQ